MLSIFELGSRFNSGVNVGEVLWYNKSDFSLSKSISFKIMAIAGLLTMLWFSLSESCEQLFDSLLKFS